MGHKGPIYDVEFSPNGALIASCSKDETVKIWNNTMFLLLLLFIYSNKISIIAP